MCVSWASTRAMSEPAARDCWIAAAGSQSRSYRGNSLVRGHDWHNLEINEIPPHPLLEKPAIIAFHHLEAATEIVRDPACNATDALRSQASLVAEAAVDGDCVPAPKMLDDHEKHYGSSATFGRPTDGA